MSEGDGGTFSTHRTPWDPSIEGPNWASRVSRAIEKAPFERGTADQWIARVRAGGGLAEAQHSGLIGDLEAMAGSKQTLGKADVLAMHAEGAPKLRESTRGEPRPAYPDEVATREVLQQRVDDARADVEAHPDDPDLRAALDDAVASHEDLSAALATRGRTAHGKGRPFDIYAKEPWTLQGEKLRDYTETPLFEEKMAGAARAAGNESTVPMDHWGITEEPRVRTAGTLGHIRHSQVELPEGKTGTVLHEVQSDYWQNVHNWEDRPTQLVDGVRVETGEPSLKEHVQNWRDEVAALDDAPDRDPTGDVRSKLLARIASAEQVVAADRVPGDIMPNEGEHSGLLIRRGIAEAAARGDSHLLWPAGEVQAERNFGLNHYDGLVWDAKRETMSYEGGENAGHTQRGVSRELLPAFVESKLVAEELAARAARSHDGRVVLRGDDLEAVVSRGLRERSPEVKSIARSYDEKTRNFVKKELRKLNIRDEPVLEQVDIGGGRTSPMWKVALPEVRARISERGGLDYWMRMATVGGVGYGTYKSLTKEGGPALAGGEILPVLAAGMALAKPKGWVKSLAEAAGKAATESVGRYRQVKVTADIGGKGFFSRTAQVVEGLWGRDLKPGETGYEPTMSPQQVIDALKKAAQNRQLSLKEVEHVGLWTPAKKVGDVEYPARGLLAEKLAKGEKVSIRELRNALKLAAQDPKGELSGYTIEKQYRKYADDVARRKAEAEARRTEEELLDAADEEPPEVEYDYDEGRRVYDRELEAAKQNELDFHEQQWDEQRDTWETAFKDLYSHLDETTEDELGKSRWPREELQRAADHMQWNDWEDIIREVQEETPYHGGDHARQNRTFFEELLRRVDEYGSENIEDYDLPMPPDGDPNQLALMQEWTPELLPTDVRAKVVAVARWRDALYEREAREMATGEAASYAREVKST
ncbi:MAG TPA: hypothetical protein VMZ50_05850, partial [Phycisphaerae bacterium]|nr:hypothetical protein [Phycisphaerae bacterium]